MERSREGAKKNGRGRPPIRVRQIQREERERIRRAEILRAEMERLGITLTQIARQLGISRQAVAAGCVTVPRIIKALVEAGVPKEVFGEKWVRKGRSPEKCRKVRAAMAARGITCDQVARELGITWSAVANGCATVPRTVEAIIRAGVPASVFVFGEEAAQ